RRRRGEADPGRPRVGRVRPRRRGARGSPSTSEARLRSRRTRLRLLGAPVPVAVAELLRPPVGLAALELGLQLLDVHGQRALAALQLLGQLGGGLLTTLEPL